MTTLALNNAVLLVFSCFLVVYSVSVSGRLATFLEDFRVTWSDSHIRQIDGGRAIQLVLDQNSGYTFRGVGHLIFFFMQTLNNLMIIMIN